MNRTQRRRAQAGKPLPGFQQRLLAAASALAAMPGVSDCIIQHDNWCAVYQRRPCDCVPDITVVNGDNLLVIDADGQARRNSKQ